MMREVSLETLPNVNICDPSHDKNLPIMSVTGSINTHVFKLKKKKKSLKNLFYLLKIIAVLSLVVVCYPTRVWELLCKSLHVKKHHKLVSNGIQ